MLRQIIGYGPASLLPAFLSFAMVYVFTRMLPRAEYGLYTLAWNSILLGQSVLFYSLAQGTARLYPSAQLNRTTMNLLKSGYCILGVLAAIGVLLTGLVTLLSADTAIWFVGPLLILRGTINLNQDINRIAGRVLRYTLVVATDAMIGFIAALILVRLMPTATSLLLGLSIGSLCGMAIDGPRIISAVRSGNVERPVVQQILHIGGPLGLTFLLSASLQYADRFIVGGIISTGELATYAVAWALVSQPVTIIGSSIAIATTPLAMHALDVDGHEAGREQAGRNGMLIIALIAPAAGGLAVCHEQLAGLLTGPEFHSMVSRLIPYIAGISFLRAVSMFYLEQAFYLSRRSDLMLYAYTPAAVVNVVLNLIAAPIFGISGVLVTAGISQILTTLGLLFFARNVFPLPFPPKSLLTTAVATLAMMLVVYVLHADVTWLGLLRQIGIGGLVYGVAMFLLDGLQIRSGRRWMLGRR
jgi:O-antigen/teichoic acid export membrane protein